MRESVRRRNENGVKPVALHGAFRRPAAQTLVVALAASACSAGWRRPLHFPPEALPPRQQVQVWQRGAAVRWHAVRITNDSVSGVPYLRGLECDSCRAALPLAGVDSIRLGHPVAAFWKTVGLVVAVPVGFMVVVCWRGCGLD
jgi:hypothetical protein